MQSILVLSAAGQWLQRVLCRIREARRLQADLDVLATMSAHELRDIGISHSSVVSAAARRATDCA